MSRSPSGTSASSSSSTWALTRAASSAPRRWIPTIASASGSAFFSTISWAMRTSVRRMSSRSRTTFSGKSISSFLASRDRVKGACVSVLQASSGGGGSALRCRRGRRGADQLGLALLRERHLDRVEVARDLGVREDRARLLAHLPAAVPCGQMRQREQTDLGVAGERGGLAGGRVPGLLRARGLLGRERRLVDEDVGLVGDHLEHLRRAGGARDEEPWGPAVGADDLLGRDAVDRLAALEAAEVRAGRDPEALGELGVEAPGPRVLDEGVRERRAAVARVDRVDLVAAALDHLARLELDDVQRVAQPPVDDAHELHDLAQRRGAVDGQRDLAVTEVERLEHPG